MRKACKCGSTDLEHWGEGEYSDSCYRCNDVEIERSNKIREWNHFHPGTPIPKSELDN